MIKILSNFSKIMGNFAKFCKNQRNFQRFLTKILRLENGARFFFLEAPFAEVLSGLLWTAYWPLVFLFSPLFGVVLARSFFPHFSIVDSKPVQRSALCRSRRELSHVPFLNLLFEQIANSNEYLLAKFGFDTAEKRSLQSLPKQASDTQPRS